MRALGPKNGVMRLRPHDLWCWRYDRLLYRQVESLWKVTVQCDRIFIFFWMNTTKTTNISKRGFGSAGYESVFREKFLVGSVIHSVYDTLHSQEVRRLHSI